MAARRGRREPVSLARHGVDVFVSDDPSPKHKRERARMVPHPGEVTYRLLGSARDIGQIWPAEGDFEMETRKH